MFPHVRGERGKYSVSDRGSRNSGREDHGYLERGSGGGKVGEAREERGGQFSPTGLVDLVGRKSTSFMEDNCRLFT